MCLPPWLKSTWLAAQVRLSSLSTSSQHSVASCACPGVPKSDFFFLLTVMLHIACMKLLEFGFDEKKKRHQELKESETAQARVRPPEAAQAFFLDYVYNVHFLSYLAGLFFGLGCGSCVETKASKAQGSDRVVGFKASFNLILFPRLSQ